MTSGKLWVYASVRVDSSQESHATSWISKSKLNFSIACFTSGQLNMSSEPSMVKTLKVRCSA